MARLRDHRGDLQALIGAAAAQRGVEQVFVEKDFWVTEVLRAATTPAEILAKDGTPHAVSTIFKGGTSLSRVYGLIERFSEDVDLLIGFPAADSSTTAKEKLLKGIRDAVAQHLGLDPAHVINEAATTGVKRNVRYLYPPFGDGAGAVSTGVLLEMGCRGGTAPTRQHELRSMLADHAVEVLRESSNAWDEFAPVAVQVLAPERTLLEKLALLHDGAARSPDDNAHERLLKAGRHLYDADRLLASEQVLTALQELGPDGVAQLCSDIDGHSARAGFSFTPRPQGGYGESPLLDPSASCRAVLARGYETTMALVYGERPSFDDCINTIRAHAALL